MSDPANGDNAQKRALYVKCGFQYGPSASSPPAEEWGYGYAPYCGKDEIYYGARAVVDMEWEAYLKYRCASKHTNAVQAQGTRRCLTGLAFSGGGIRSASFSLGVMQALAKAGWLKNIDYLSTVSGGGYLGASFTWLLHKTWDVPTETPSPNTEGTPAQNASDSVSFGLDWKNFPFRTYPIAENTASSKGGAEDATFKEVYAGRILRYLRQHARYLTPGGGLDWVSLAAVVLRNSLFSLVVYGSILVLVFFMLHWASLRTGFELVPKPCPKPELLACFSSADKPDAALFKAAGLVLLFWVAVVALYALLTHCFGKDWFFGKGKHTNYAWRYWHEKLWGRWPLIFALVLAILGSIPAAHYWLGKQGISPPEQAFSIKGTPSQAGEWAIEGTLKLPALKQAGKEAGTEFGQTLWQNLKDKIVQLSGIISTLVGVVMSLFAFKQTSAVKAARIPTGVVVGVGSVALIFGVLLLAYHVYFWTYWHMPNWTVWTLPIQANLAAVALIILLARFADINQMSLHRYYRDRLMETFLPNVKDALDVQGAVAGGAKLHESDGTKLYEMCQASMARRQEEGTRRENQRPLGPYHIINTNIVLVSSSIPKFRGRGGDNFILTPLCCGSNATGWCETGSKPDKTHPNPPDSAAKTVDSPFESMTLATAMAISGAAVNPNTGSGGQGITRQPLLSFLMGILNIRLGYWAPNPSPRSEYLRRIQVIEKKRTAYGWWRWLRFSAYRLITSPTLVGNENAISPGIGELFLRRYLDENSHSIQLSDGGHFENLGLYELVRRRLKVIIVCDGAEDKEYGFSCLANAIEKVRADFGARIEIEASDLEPLIPRRDKKPDEGETESPAFSPCGYLVANIRYAKVPGEDALFVGTLIYLTTTFFKNLTADLYAYKKAHPEFPDQSTSDQFFDEAQFEAYRELGFQTAHRMMCDAHVRVNENLEILGEPDISCPDKWRQQSAKDEPEVWYRRMVNARFTWSRPI